MSNQIYANETELYPIIENAKTIESDTGEFYKFKQYGINPALGATLTVVEKNSGTLADPDIMDFRKNYAYDENLAGVTVAPGADVQVYVLNAGPIIPGTYEISIWVMYLQSFSGPGDTNWTMEFYYTNNIDGAVLVYGSLIYQDLSAVGANATGFYKFKVTVPEGAINNSFAVNFNNTGKTSGQQKQRAILTLNAIY